MILPVEGVERFADAEKKIIEQFLKRFDIAGALNQGCAQGAAKQRRVGDADQFQRAEGVHVLGDSGHHGLPIDGANHIGELVRPSRSHWFRYRLPPEILMQLDPFVIACAALSAAALVSRRESF